MKIKLVPNDGPSQIVDLARVPNTGESIEMSGEFFVITSMSHTPQPAEAVATARGAWAIQVQRTTGFVDGGNYSSWTGNVSLVGAEEKS